MYKVMSNRPTRCRIIRFLPRMYKVRSHKKARLEDITVVLRYILNFSASRSPRLEFLPLVKVKDDGTALRGLSMSLLRNDAGFRYNNTKNWLNR